MLQDTHAIGSCSSESVQPQELPRWRAILRRHFFFTSSKKKRSQQSLRVLHALRLVYSYFFFVPIFFSEPYKACLRLSQWRSLSALPESITLCVCVFVLCICGLCNHCVCVPTSTPSPRPLPISLSLLFLSLALALACIPPPSPPPPCSPVSL